MTVEYSLKVDPITTVELVLSYRYGTPTMRCYLWNEYRRMQQEFAAIEREGPNARYDVQPGKEYPR